MAQTVRQTIMRLVATQHGLVTRAQIERLHGTVSTALMLRRMVATGDLYSVLNGVWAHVAVEPAPSPKIEAEALWLLSEPDRTIRERRERFQLESSPTAVLGGGAAYEYWGFGYMAVPPMLAVPDASHLPAASSSFVEIRVREVPRRDIVWRYDEFPYRSVESSLVDGLRHGLGLDDIAPLLRDAMWTHHPLDHDLLLAHMTELAAKDDQSLHDARLMYVDLVALAGGWAEQAGGRAVRWNHNRAAVDALLERDAAADAADPEGGERRRRAREEQLQEIYADRRVDTEDASIAVRLRSERTFDDLIASSSSPASVAQALRVDVAELTERVADGSLHVYMADRGPVYPDWQFGLSLPIPHLREVLAAVPTTMHSVSLSGFMTRPQATLSADGNVLSPRQWLVDGNDPSRVVALLIARQHR